MTNSRTSSRLLYPPDIKRTSSSVLSSTTPHPVSFITTATPEYNHISYLTHPKEKESYQTRFDNFQNIVFTTKSPTKTSKSHTFFQMGRVETKPNQPKIDQKEPSDVQSPVHNNIDRQLVSIVCPNLPI